MDRLPHENAIELHDLSKVYRIWKDPSARLRGPLLQSFAGFLPPVSFKKKLLVEAASCSRRFEALKPLSLDIPRGQCLGIIGRNGSGKSTLLQLICGILRPTTGSVNVQGRVAALLELGSGFNPEFTGRENVYLNASILGLSKEEVDARFAQIVGFADIGDFVEQPVKTYSSGMMLRLAFAVQILVDPDILIVDEALSVGDEPFQRKCFARLEQLRDAGVTVLFVSHDMTPVVSMCDRAILMHKGELVLDGAPKEVASAYQRFNHAPPDRAEVVLEQLRSSIGSNNTIGPVVPQPVAPDPSVEVRSEEDYDASLEPESTVVYDRIGARIENIRLLDESGRKVNLLRRREFYRYCYTVEFDEACGGVNFAMLIKTLMGVELGGARSYPAHLPIRSVEAGSRWEISFRFQCLLTPGCYCMNAGVEGIIDDRPSYVHRVLDALLFKVQPEQDLIPTMLVDFLIAPSCKELGQVGTIAAEAVQAG